jgi:predicted peroxiredoxin
LAQKFCVNLTCAKDDTDKSTVAFVIANAALGSEKDALVFLSTEGVRLSQKGYADDVHEEGFLPLKELMDNFASVGGSIYVCAPCFNKRGLDPNNLVDGAQIVGGAVLVEFLSDNSPVISF